MAGIVGGSVVGGCINNYSFFYVCLSKKKKKKNRNEVNEKILHKVTVTKKEHLKERNK